MCIRKQSRRGEWRFISDIINKWRVEFGTWWWIQWTCWCILKEIRESSDINQNSLAVHFRKGENSSGNVSGSVRVRNAIAALNEIEIP